MSLYSGKHFRSSLRHFLVGRAAQGILAVVFTLVVVRVMDLASYGAYLVLIGLVDLFRPLSTLGILPMVQQYLPALAEHATPAYLRGFIRWTRLIRGLLLAFVALVMYFVWVPVAAWAGFSSVEPLPAWLPGVVIFTMLAVEFVEQMLEALLDQKAAQLLRLFHALGRLVALLVLAATDQVALQNMLLVDAVAAGACWLAAEVALWRAVRRIVPDGSKVFERHEFVRFAWHMTGSQFLGAFSTAGAFRLVVARLLGLEAAGLFGFMQALMHQFNRLLPSIMLSSLIRPMLIARRAKGEAGRVADACALLWRSNSLCLWPLVPLVYGGGELIARALSGGRATDGLAFTAMFIALIAMTQAQVNAMILQVHKRSGDVVRASSLSLLAPLFVAAGATVSLAGAGFGLFAAYAVRSAFSTWLIQRSAARMALDTRGALAYALAIVLAGAAALLLRLVWPFSAAVAAYVLLLPVLVLLVKPLHSRDVAVIADALGRPLPWMRWIASSSRP